MTYLENRKTSRNVCLECGQPFTPKKGQQRYVQAFCSPSHKLAYHNRAAKRGKPIMPLLQAWRAARGSKDEAVKETARRAFAEICRFADLANAEDREAGRAPAIAVVRRQYAQMIRKEV